MTRLACYRDLIEACNQGGMITLLGWGPEGWVLEVNQADELLTQVSSRLGAPACFEHLAIQATADLTRL